MGCFGKRIFRPGAWEKRRQGLWQQWELRRSECSAWWICVGGFWEFLKNAVWEGKVYEHSSRLLKVVIKWKSEKVKECKGFKVLINNSEWFLCEEKKLRRRKIRDFIKNKKYSITKLEFVKSCKELGMAISRTAIKFRGCSTELGVKAELLLTNEASGLRPFFFSLFVLATARERRLIF